MRMTRQYKNPRPKRKKRVRLRIGRVLIVLVVIIALIAGAGKLYNNMAVRAVNPNSKQDIIVEIPDGSSAKSIAKILKDKNLIRNKRVFVNQVENTGKAEKILAGKYKLSQNMDNKTIADKLVNGKIYQDGKKVTIPEGSLSSEIVDILVKNNLGDRDKFTKLFKSPDEFSSKFKFLKNSKITTLEGFLYPETYYIKKGASEKEIFTNMISEFEKNYNKYARDDAQKNKYDFYDTVIMASIVEKEAVNDSDRDIIAGIFYNRLDKNMRLQSDAVLQYGLPERKGRVLFKDLKVKSPYNLYLNNGLPPTPVASPGIKSLKAAANPKKTDYLYFVTNKDGTNSYSKTFKEHKQSADKYRQEMYGDQDKAKSKEN